MYINALEEFVVRVFVLTSTILFVRTQLVSMTDRPGKDASAAEIAKWMENDFWDSFADGIEDADTDESTDEGDRSDR